MANLNLGFDMSRCVFVLLRAPRKTLPCFTKPVIIDAIHVIAKKFVSGRSFWELNELLQNTAPECGGQQGTTPAASQGFVGCKNFAANSKYFFL